MKPYASIKISPSLLETDEYRVEGRNKVTGQARYTADFARPGTLWAAFVSSTVPHARIRSVDVSEAKRCPGVHAVLTGADIPDRFLGRVLMDWPVLAHEKVHFLGQYVAAVAAETREMADEAARHIRVHYDELPPIFDPKEALAEDAALVHEDRSRYRFLADPVHHKPPMQPHPNIQGRVVVEEGDVEAAFNTAARVFEHNFSTPSYHGGYIEPHATLVWIETDGKTHVVSTCKSPFLLRRELAVCAGLSIDNVIVEQCNIGGDFGAKGLSIDDFPCYFLARATGRPVKSVRSYLDDIRSTNVRHAAEITIKSGVDKEGHLVALSTRVLYNGGAFAAAKPIPTLIPGSFWWNDPYRIPNTYAEAVAAYTNTVPAGHVRSPGAFQIVFAVESHMDMVANDLGMDPIDFRLKNVLVRNDPGVDKSPYVEPRGKDVLEILRTAGMWDEPLPPGRGKGIAIYAHHIGYGSAEIRMALSPDGTITVHTPMMDQGVGALTMLQRTAAQTLGIGVGWFKVRTENSASTLVEGGPSAARVTAVTGRACQEAANKIRMALEESGWDGSEESYLQAARKVCGHEAFIEVIGSFARVHKEGEPDYYNFAGFLVDLSVDKTTGTIEIHDILHVVDVGTIINPVSHQGQIDGGFLFGIGHALTEELIVEDGRIINLSFGDYKIPTQKDLPPFRTLLLHAPEGPGPFGAKAIGEASTVGVAPALANAVARACGARISTLPITAARIFAALDDARRES